MTRTILVTITLFLALRLSRALEPCNLQNFDFASFADADGDLGQSIPTDWLWAVGKTTSGGASVVDTVVSSENGLTLRNTAETNRFLQIHQFFNQTVVATEEEPLVMYEAEARDVVTTGFGGRNAYIKVATVLPQADVPAFDDVALSSSFLFPFPETTHGSLLRYVFLPPGTRRVSVFNDGVGSLSVGSVCVRRVDNYIASLIKYIGRFYSHFGVRGPTLEQFFRDVADLPSQVANLQVAQLNAALQVIGSLTQTDPHVYLKTADSGEILASPSFRSPDASTLWEASFSAAVSQLTGLQTWRTGDGMNTLAALGLISVADRQAAYLLLTSLSEPSSTYLLIRRAMVELFEQTDDFEIIVDLRYNPGGSETEGLRFLRDIIAAAAVDTTNTKQVTYATNAFRIDPDDESLFFRTERAPVEVMEKSEAKIVVMTSRNCVSSCEGTVLAFQAAGATLVGENTAGASGNPQPFLIPKVAQVFVSTWKAGDASGAPFETIGIEPDVIVDGSVTISNDIVLEAALRALDPSHSPNSSAVFAPYAKTPAWLLGILIVVLLT